VGKLIVTAVFDPAYHALTRYCLSVLAARSAANRPCIVSQCSIHFARRLSSSSTRVSFVLSLLIIPPAAKVEGIISEAVVRPSVQSVRPVHHAALRKVVMITIDRLK